MENLEQYIRNHESSLNGVISRKLDSNSLTNNSFISSRIVSNINNSIHKDFGGTNQKSVQYKYHSNRPQRSQQKTTSISRIGSHGKAAVPKIALSTPTSASASNNNSNYNNSAPQSEVVPPSSLGSIEKQLEDFSFRLNSLKMKRSLQLQQLHQLILTDIAIEETAYYGNETDNAIQQADEEYHNFVSMGNQMFDTTHSTGSSIIDDTDIDIVELPSEWSPHTSGRTATLQNLLRELDVEKNRSMKAKSLDDLLGYQTD